NRSAPTPARESPLLNSAGVNELDGSFSLRLGDYLGFTFLSRYDLSTTTLGTTTLGPHFLERDYLVRLISRCNCWVLQAGVSDKTNPDERLFRVQFTLFGLGSFGRTPVPAGFVAFAPPAQLQRPGLGPGEGFHLPPGTRHRVTALEDTDILEVSTPELDDVVRLEDRYGRVT